MSVKRFDEIIGHEAIIERLKRDLESGLIPHAYLFTGPQGVGKATVAELVLRAMLCLEDDVAKKPCGECIACKKVLNSNHPDFHVVKLDKDKRQIRIDQIRQIQAELALKPYEAQWKTVLIDDADFLNESAQNALLKTLEEPPGDTLIILVCASQGNLLPTIISRCRIERFGPLPTEKLKTLLIDKVGLSERDAILAGGMANGSVGKALSIDIKSLLKTREEIKRIIENLTIPDHSRAEKVINSAEFFVKAGEEGLVILQTLLRDIAVLKVNGGQMINRDIEDELKAKASKWSIEETVQKFEAVVEALDKLNRNVNKSLVYESLALALAD